MKLLVKYQAPMAFVAETERGSTLRLDGNETLGGDPTFLRPMEGVLASLASCSGVDVALILNKQKQPLEGLRIEVEATRADAVPAVFESIHLRFLLEGEIAPNKAARAVALSVEKYCSVIAMLRSNVRVSYSVQLGAETLTEATSLPEP